MQTFLTKQKAVGGETYGGRFDESYFLLTVWSREFYMVCILLMSVFMVANMKANGTPMGKLPVPLIEGLSKVGREQPPYDTPQRSRRTN